MSVSRLRTLDFLKSAGTEHCDVEMLEKISSFSDSLNIPYHKCCRDQYLRDISKGDESDFSKKRKASNTAYDMICEMLEQYVVKKNECLLFDHVKKEYRKLLIEQCAQLSDSINITSFSDRHLERKITDTFQKTIKIVYAEKKKFLAPLSLNIVAYDALFKAMAMKETR